MTAFSQGDMTFVDWWSPVGLEFRCETIGKPLGFGKILSRQTKAVLQVVHRMFPFARGLYEDKVANFWCSISVAAWWTEFPMVSLY